MNEHQFSQLLDKAQFHEEHGQWLHASQFYLRILREQPGLTDITLKLARVYAEMENVSAAEQVLLNALGRDRNNPDILFSLGRIFYNAGDLDRALYYFEQLVPHRIPQAHHTIGLIHFQRENFVSAERHLLRAYELDPAMHSLHAILAEALLKNGHARKAVEVLRETQRLLPGDWKTGYLLGVAYTAMQRWQDAFEAFSVLLLARPDDVDALCAAASVLVQLRELGKADEFLRRAQGIAPQSPVVLNHLGTFALLKADRMKARAYFSQVLEIDPTNVTALEHLKIFETAST